MKRVFEVPKPVSGKVMSSEKPKIKVLAKKPLNKEYDEFSPALKNNLPATDDRNNSLINERKFKSTPVTKQVISGFGKSSATQNQMKGDFGKIKHNCIAGCKRKSEQVLVSHEIKRLKMDCLATARCQEILTKLIKHDQSALFLAPVEPDKWGIKDYFDIIKKPMDLGTINKKLRQKSFGGVEEFEADVRLTFSNAMKYNPPGNWVHEYAKQFNKFFDRLWMPVKMKMSREHKDVEERDPGCSQDSNQGKSVYDVKNTWFKSHVGQLSEETMPGKEKVSKDSNVSAERQKLRDHKVVEHKDIKETDPGYRQDSYRNKNLGDVRKTWFSFHDDQLSEETMPVEEKASKALKVSAEGQKLSDRNDVEHKGVKERDSGCSHDYHQTKNVYSVVDKYSSSHDRHMSKSAMTGKEKGSKNLKMSAEKQKHSDHKDVNNGKPDDSSSSVDKERTFSGSAATTANRLETLREAELPSSEDLRIARLKNRFAKIILKAQNNTLLEQVGENNGAKADAANWHQRKTILEKSQHEGKSRTDAQIRAAQLKADSELKRQRQLAREADRIAIGKVKSNIHNLHKFYFVWFLKILRRW
ncbi:transcription factor GTE9-like isoform X2 [Amaranthus tricolor]|uniref:transcription factor GTE9-like isoform X2 n=1 Tax=Amaranthus tricolor TaxID=29722 RepID=UPI00258A93FD|nr:transcription factor GTE9-like isoform X2 [Amaranthus tricolor]